MERSGRSPKSFYNSTQVLESFCNISIDEDDETSPCPALSCFETTNPITEMNEENWSYSIQADCSEKVKAKRASGHRVSFSLPVEEEFLNITSNITESILNGQKNSTPNKSPNQKSKIVVTKIPPINASKTFSAVSGEATTSKANKRKQRQKKVTLFNFISLQKN